MMAKNINKLGVKIKEVDDINMNVFNMKEENEMDIEDKVNFDDKFLNSKQH